ncbi:MAG: hypothetical protein ACRC92_15855, partial [Peptostreptococcaceae bacterium]
IYMKKLALLLGSLLVVGATASAKEAVVAPVEVSKEVVVVAEPVAEVVVIEEAPTLRLTSIKTGIWSENKTGKTNGNLGSNSARLYTNFAYGEDWTGSFAMRRYFTSNTKDSYGDNDLFAKGSTRTYVGIERSNIFDNYSLGFTYISQNSWDKFDLTLGFAPTNWLSGYFLYEYASRQNNEGDYDGSDSNYIEFQPKLSYNGWGVSYYFEGEYAIENDAEYTYQQIRLFTPKAKLGKFAVSGEYRGFISYDSKDVEGKDQYGMGDSMKDAFDVNRFYAHTTYELTSSTTLFTSLGYQFGKWENTKGNKKDRDMTIVETGVTIKF